MVLQILPELSRFQELVSKANLVDSLTGGGLGAPGTPAGSSPSIMGGRDYDALQGLLPDVGDVAPNVPGNISGMPPVQGISPDGQTGGPLDRITGGLRKVNELIENLPILSQFLGTPTQEVRRDLLRAQTAGTAPWEAQQEHARGMAGAGMSFDVIQEMNKMAQAERDRQFQAQLKEIELRKRGEIAESRDRTAMDVAQIGAGQRREAATGRELQGLMEGYDMASPEMRKLVRDRLRRLGYEIGEDEESASGPGLLQIILGGAPALAAKAIEVIKGAVGSRLAERGREKPTQSLEDIFGK